MLSVGHEYQSGCYSRKGSVDIVVEFIVVIGRWNQMDIIFIDEPVTGGRYDWCRNTDQFDSWLVHWL